MDDFKIAFRDTLLERLNAYPRIKDCILSEWGTNRLDKYLIHLTTDNVEGKRQGFPFEIFECLLELQLLNIEELREMGVYTEPDFHESYLDFSNSQWKLPKNF